MQSPSSVLSTQATDLHQVGGRPLPMGYGDFEAEVEALTHGAGLVDLTASGVVGVRGPDAAAFLNGVVTNNTKTLPVGRIQDNLICNTKGKILHAVILLRIKEQDYLVGTEPGELEAVAAYLDLYHVREDLELGVAGLVRLDLIGPQGETVLRSAGIDPNALIQSFAGASVVVTPYPLGQHPRRFLLAPMALVPQLIAGLVAAGAKLAGYAAYDECRIWAKVPRFGADFTSDFLPAEAAVYTHIAFEKGCYVGQEVHARQHYRGHANRKLVTVDIPVEAAADLHPGSPLYAGDQDVGTLTGLSKRALPVPEAKLPLARRGVAVVRYAVASECQPLALSTGGPALVRVQPLATDLGAAFR
jgi:folate-binding protein YgfZ